MMSLKEKAWREARRDLRDLKEAMAHALAIIIAAESAAERADAVEFERTVKSVENVIRDFPFVLVDTVALK